jgi:hypothetical protein
VDGVLLALARTVSLALFRDIHHFGYICHSERNTET